MGSISPLTAGNLAYQVQSSKSVIADFQFILSGATAKSFKIHFPGAEPAALKIELRKFADAGMTAYAGGPLVLYQPSVPINSADDDDSTFPGRHVVASAPVTDITRIAAGHSQTCAISLHTGVVGTHTEYWEVWVTGLASAECWVEQANNTGPADSQTIRRVMCDPDALQLAPSSAAPFEGDPVTLHATAVDPTAAASVYRLPGTTVAVPAPAVSYKWNYPEPVAIPTLAVSSATEDQAFTAPAVTVPTPITLTLTVIYDESVLSMGLLNGADGGAPKVVTIGSLERNLILLLDRSGSMLGSLGGGATKWQETVNAAHVWADLAVAFRDGVNAGDEAGIMTFQADACGWSTMTVGAPILVRTPATGLMGAISALNRTTAQITGELGAPGTCTPIGDAMVAALGKFTAAANQKYLIVLMTDGYENSGEIYMDDESPPPGAVHDYATELAAVNAQIRNNLTVYTIGVGMTVQPNVLDDLPTNPGAMPGYYRLVTSMPELLPTFAAMLGDWLNAQMIPADAAADPTDPEVGTPGAYFPMTPFEHRVAIVLPWASDTDRLVVKVRKTSPANEPWTIVAGAGAIGGLPAGSVNAFFRSTHGIVSIKIKEVLDVAFAGVGNTVGTQWKVEYHAAGALAASAIMGSLLVMVDLYVKGEVSFDQPKYFTGDPLKLTCRLAAGSKAIRGAEVTVELARPGEGLGNFLAVNGTGYQPSIPAGADPNAPKPTMLLDLLRQKEMNQLPVETPVAIFSDGTNRLNDGGNRGVYANTYVNADKEGTYTWLVRVKGKLADGSSYRRLFVMSKWVDVKVDPVASVVTVAPAPNPPKGQQAALITIRPQDKRGQLVGPFRPGLFKFSTTAGTFQGGVVSLPNGNYVQQLNYPPGQNPVVTVIVQGKPFKPVPIARGCFGLLIDKLKSFLGF